MFTSGLICILKELEFQESDLQAVPEVFEIGFGSWMSLIFLLNKIVKHQRLEGNENKWSGIQRIKFSKFLQNVWKHSFISHCSFITFVHVHWATNAQWMSGLHMFSSSPCIVWLFCMWTCRYPKHSFQHKHFAWLEVNSYKLK